MYARVYVCDMADIREIRELFPALTGKVYGKDLVYLDNAATSQRPRSVIDLWNRLTVQSNANIHRAVHRMADEATQAYEQARDAVADFLNAGSREEIVFTSGTTASINLVAFCFGEAFVKAGDEVIVTEAEHHSNIVPWQMMCQRKGAVLKVLPVDDDGHLDLDRLEDLISDRPRYLEYHMWHADSFGRAKGCTLPQMALVLFSKKHQTTKWGRIVCLHPARNGSKHRSVH